MGSLVGTGIITEKNINLEKTNGKFRNALRTDAPTSPASLSPAQVVAKPVALAPAPAPSRITSPTPVASYTPPSIISAGVGGMTGERVPTSTRTTSPPVAGSVPIGGFGSITPVSATTRVTTPTGGGGGTGTISSGGETSGGGTAAGMCPKNYAPVVGASGTVYANSCIAEQSGETSWITYAEYQAGGSPGGTGTGGTGTGTGGGATEAPAAGGTPWTGMGGMGGGGGSFDMSAPMAEGPGMGNYTPVAYDDKGNAIYGYSQDGTPIYGVDENGNVINDPTKAKEAKAKEMGLTPVYKQKGRGFLFLIALAAVTTYVIFKK